MKINGLEIPSKNSPINDSRIESSKQSNLLGPAINKDGTNNVHPISMTIGFEILQVISPAIGEDIAYEAANIPKANPTFFYYIPISTSRRARTGSKNKVLVVITTIIISASKHRRS